jgi:acetyl esterase
VRRHARQRHQSFAGGTSSIIFLCGAVAQEACHVWGLDHELNAADPMTYLELGSLKRFQNDDADCGEDNPRGCRCGGTTQNSFRYMTNTFGLSPSLGDPTLAITTPTEGQWVKPSFPIGAVMTSELATIDAFLAIDGAQVANADNGILAFNAPALPSGPHAISLTATDAGDRTVMASVTVNVIGECSAATACPSSFHCLGGALLSGCERGRRPRHHCATNTSASPASAPRTAPTRCARAPAMPARARAASVSRRRERAGRARARAAARPTAAMRPGSPRRARAARARSAPPPFTVSLDRDESRPDPRYGAAVKARLLRGVARVALGAPIVGVLGRKRRSGIDGELDPQIAAVLELQRLMRLPALETMEPVRARRFAEAGLGPLDVPSEPMAHVIDTRVRGPAGSIPVRIYEPHDATPHWIVYFHGGGGVIGSIRGSDPVVRLMAAQTGCTVASVGYRLGPEDPHPAAIDDACSAWDALVARLARCPRGGRRRCASAASSRRTSIRAVVRNRTSSADLSARRSDAGVALDRSPPGYLLTRSMMRWFRAIPPAPERDQRAASPRFWPDCAASPAIVVNGYAARRRGDRYVTRSGVMAWSHHRRIPR